jgi:TolA protein
MPKKKKEGRSWGLVFSILLHGSIILLVLIWGIKKYTATNITQPINVSLSALEYKGSSDKAGDSVKSTKAENSKKEAEEPKKEEKPEIKEEPKEEVVKKEEPKEKPRKEDPKKEEVVEKEEPKKEIVEEKKEEPDKKVVALEEKKKEPEKEVKKEPKKEEPKKEKKKEVKKKKKPPNEKKEDSKVARDNVINDLKRKSVIDKLGKSENSTKTASAKESTGLKGNDSNDVAGNTGKVNTALLGVYKNAIFRKIEPKFKIPPNIPKDGSLSSDIFFKINNSGNVSGVKVAKSSGNPAFDNFCINTIISSSPLPAPPSDISKLVIREGFQITLRNEQ